MLTLNTAIGKELNVNFKHCNRYRINILTLQLI